MTNTIVAPDVEAVNMVVTPKGRLFGQRPYKLSELPGFSDYFTWNEDVTERKVSYSVEKYWGYEVNGLKFVIKFAPCRSAISITSPDLDGEDRLRLGTSAQEIADHINAIAREVMA